VKSFNKYSGINKTANKLVDRLEQFEKLKEIANRRNYPHKIKLLEEKIEEQYTFWKKKDHEQRLLDLEKDLIFIRSQRQECSIDKQRIDLLMEKYGYGKSN
jgi:hypothetical protein